MRFERLTVWLLAVLAALSAPTAALADPEGSIDAQRAAMCDPLYPGQVLPVDTGQCIVTPANFPASKAEEVIGDGVSPYGGLPPIYTQNIGDKIDTPDLTLYTTQFADPALAGCGSDTSVNPCGRPDGTFENKFRLSLGVPLISYNDPIRNFGMSGGAHCHMFYGAAETNANTTYATLRIKRSAADYSGAEGNNVNNTAYWQPCLTTQVGGTLPTVTTVNGVKAVTLDQRPTDGQLGVILPGGDGELSKVTGYYVTDSAGNTGPIPPKFRYVAGYNVDYPEDRRDRRDRAAEQNPGTTYTFTGSNNLNEYSKNGGYVSHVWECNGIQSPYLRRADGTDAFDGQCTPATDSGIQLKAEGPICIDGQNLTTPSGYDHAIEPLWINSDSARVCPLGYYKIPKIQLNMSFEHCGFDPDPTGCGYGVWEWSSDNMAVTPQGMTSTNGTRGVWPGLSFHWDLLFGWDQRVHESWVDTCNGSGLLDIVAGTEGFECNDGAYSFDAKLNNHDPVTQPLLKAGIVPVPEKNSMPIMGLPRRISANDNGLNDNEQFVMMGSETHGAIGGGR